MACCLNLICISSIVLVSISQACLDVLVTIIEEIFEECCGRIRVLLTVTKRTIGSPLSVNGKLVCSLKYRYPFGNGALRPRLVINPIRHGDDNPERCRASRLLQLTVWQNLSHLRRAYQVHYRCSGTSRSIGE
jgi:hypothetical protein